MPNASTSFYEEIGGEEGIRRLIAAYIRTMRSDAESRALLSLYQTRDDALSHYEERLFEFLSGWLGGPALYLERHGMPMLREGHRNIRITPSLMKQWIQCMDQALDETVENKALRLKLSGAFTAMAQSLVNTPGAHS